MIKSNLRKVAGRSSYSLPLTLLAEILTETKEAALFLPENTHLYRFRKK